MRKIVFGINQTIDGYYDHRDGIADDEVLEYHTRLVRDADTILFGRTTYQLMVPFWPDLAKGQSKIPAMPPATPKAMYEFARAFNELNIVVFSTTLNQEAAGNARIVRGNVAEEVLALRQQPGKNISVGSLSIASQLAERGLIDEYHFLINPFLVGQGPQLFQTLKPKEKLQLSLIGSKVFRSGVVALHYRKGS